jgi:hypothetical protein
MVFGGWLGCWRTVAAMDLSNQSLLNDSTAMSRTRCLAVLVVLMRSASQHHPVHKLGIRFKQNSADFSEQTPPGSLPECGLASAARELVNLLHGEFIINCSIHLLLLAARCLAVMGWVWWHVGCRIQ